MQLRPPETVLEIEVLMTTLPVLFFLALDILKEVGLSFSHEPLKTTLETGISVAWPAMLNFSRKIQKLASRRVPRCPIRKDRLGKE